MLSLSLISLSLVASSVQAHQHHHHHRRIPTQVKRQDDPTAVVPLAQIVPVTAVPSTDTVPLPSEVPIGTVPFEGAPAIPEFTKDASWPTDLWTTPPVDSPQVVEWMKEIDWTTVPDIPLNKFTNNTCQDNAEATAKGQADGHCWWSCGGCVRDTDISTCKDKGVWGHTYDDGPSFHTNKLLKYLDSQNIKATFFLEGGNAINHPEIVRYQHANGHELGVHTWSHPPLTTLSNDQIVSELGWTRKALKDITGVTPLLFRPPYGDLDDRVRAIAAGMNLVPAMWTSIPTETDVIQWDSNDWRVHGGAEPVANQKTFYDILDMSKDLNTGVIVLQHDVYGDTVDIAIGSTIPDALKRDPPFNFKPVQVCQNTPLGNAYLETTNANPPVPKPVFNSNSASNPNQDTKVTGSGRPTPTTTRSGSIPSETKTGGASKSSVLLENGLLGAYASMLCFMLEVFVF